MSGVRIEREAGPLAVGWLALEGCDNRAAPAALAAAIERYANLARDHLVASVAATGVATA